MLVLSRKAGETIRIGEKGELSVVILGVKGNQVRIGVDAPRNMPIHRQEVFDRISTGEADRPAVVEAHD